ncbi:MAG: type II toxin-antitoxin system RelB/DinJ family antitoxin [Ruminococcus sp.]|jgi:DNA-damage-inducible protein J|nr:type II toxin-antitoxin system RelB/DinJ family antitoxin [Ruminococcus sp.]MBQ1601339.1 type II toxin-antitoxin system RelB/DinJ family antitoxin [Ruminococcus sp.]MBQ1638796.1 type II toxin-antitoxin system RelB/DinJ family antitoxin [Ruminococcus sp.]MBQ5641429.1 type II toxin-antitoxin system RelB/DinJ family antitoxin [Ruminococcus sp.]MBQ5744389.1 type II toxin-antitoxin system RelB/DinJ family antitoxin [Ruminococcus sp.]
MAQTNVNIRMDESTKKAFDAFCSEIGLSVSSVFNMFAKTVVREQRIPFEITTEVPNDTTKRAIENARNGIGLSREFHSVTELMEDLNADD